MLTFRFAIFSLVGNKAGIFFGTGGSKKRLLTVSQLLAGMDPPPGGSVLRKSLLPPNRADIAPPTSPAQARFIQTTQGPLQGSTKMGQTFEGCQQHQQGVKTNQPDRGATPKGGRSSGKHAGGQRDRGRRYGNYSSSSSSKK